MWSSHPLPIFLVGDKEQDLLQVDAHEEGDAHVNIELPLEEDIAQSGSQKGVMKFVQLQPVSSGSSLEQTRPETVLPGNTYMHGHEAESLGYVLESSNERLEFCHPRSVHMHGSIVVSQCMAPSTFRGVELLVSKENMLMLDLEFNKDDLGRNGKGMRTRAKEVFGNLQDTIGAAESAITLTEQKFYANPSEANRVAMSTAHAQLHRAIINEEKLWCQKSRMEWMRNRDSNTAFYQALFKNNRRRNFIHRLNIQGYDQWCEDQDILKDVASSYFEGLLTSERFVGNDELLQVIPSLIQTEQNSSLCTIPDSVEVFDGVKAMNEKGAPRPDGFSGSAAPPSYGIGRTMFGVDTGFLGRVSRDRSRKEYAKSRFLLSPFSEVTKAFPTALPSLAQKPFNLVKDVVDNDDHTFRRFDDIRMVLDYINLSNTPDRCVWTANANGNISTSSANSAFQNENLNRIISDITFAINVAVQGIIFKKECTQNQLSILLHYGFKPKVKMKVPKVVRWSPPQYGFSLNVDGACKGNPSPCGGGGCIRDSNGDICLGFAFFYGEGNSVIAEVRALCDGLWLAEYHGFLISIVHSDSLVLVHSFKSNRCPSWKCIWWWRAASSLLCKSTIQLVHAYRETNRVADVLAYYACDRGGCSVFSRFSLPTVCKGPALLDKTSLPSVRLF
ncbi:hypothetical protein Taro_015518 [Colocasia esculenta]|uniref:RNase H type-1 domain-containing protein n=1 Tax=Colocasia esculenta TaxID=4460 RepID=A0A843UQ41_COLES|nr:hypothetical protein [Colocasia esculenta]